MNRTRRSRPLALVVSVTLALPVVATLPAVASDPDAPQTLVPIGGGYEPLALQSFAAQVIEQASGETVDLFVVPSSYGDAPEDREENLALAQSRTDQIEAECAAVVDLAVFPEGCEATLLPLLAREDALDPATSTALTDPDTDGVWILGGDQVLAMQVLANTPAEEHLAQAYEGGVVVGGTSAGNAVESRTMGAGYPAPGWPYNALERDMSLVFWGDDLASDERGLSFGSTEVILDQHFYERGRFGRLLSWTAQSAERYGDGGKVGVGVDWATGLAIEDNTLLTDPFGYSSSAIIDLSSASTPEWVGPADTLSVRSVLTHLMAPGAGMSYAVPDRVVTLDGTAVPAQARSPLPPLTTRGPGSLWLGGGQNGDADSQVLGEFVDALSPRGRSSTDVLLVAAGYASAADASAAAATYEQGLLDLGWSGGVDVVVHGQDRLDTRTVARAAGVLVIGGDQALMDTAVADPAFARALGQAVRRPGPVMTDGAATAVMGERYVTNPDPETGVADKAIAAFRADGSQFADGLGIVDGLTLEPTLTYDYRWGRLYGAAYDDPSLVSVGISELTALRLDRSGGAVTGERSVIAVDGSHAVWAVGDNGALAAANVWMDVFGPGDQVE